VIILDTNVIWEVFKPAPSATVLGWLAAQERSGVFLTSITVAEMFEGLESLPQGKRRAQLIHAVEELLAADYSGRILPFDDSAARLYAKIIESRAVSGRPIAEFDAIIAAVARVHQFALATRNIADFQHCGIRLINPWL
jgi:toxin FitB